MTAIGKLDIGETEDLARFLLTHMDTDMRRKLMATMPVHYALAYPDVSVGIIVQRVTEEISAARNLR